MNKKHTHTAGDSIRDLLSSPNVEGHLTRDHEITLLGEMKHYKCMVNLKDFPFNSALFGLGI